MKVLAYVLGICACMAMFMVMMRVKGDVSLLLRERHALVKEQRQLMEDVKVLRAEHVYLSQLSRLTHRAKTRGFEEVRVQQLVQAVSW
ncbi:MAG: hypothetical protein OXR68_03300 [Alphaproteobacteria bacterium]|nr:hypothetical protein [Alphaproteobacteria bacterium]MDD9919632.1 hypothetical protein [Alphaproteobacteria bacterium]